MKSEKVTGQDVIDAFQKADNPAKKAWATRRLKAYIKRRASEGANPDYVERGIKARLTRLANKN